MAKILSGAPVAQAVTHWIETNAAMLAGRGIVPTAAIVRVGERPPDLACERSFTKKAERMGIRTVKLPLSPETTEKELLSVLDRVNRDDSIHGCLLLRPLPPHLNTKAVLCALRPEKDIDSMTGASIGGLITRDRTCFPPCTAEACLRLLDFYHIPIQGKNITMVGSSMTVGMPTAILLINRGATVSVCNSCSDPERLRELCRSSDIVISAVGKMGLITAGHTIPGQIILDVGINRGADGHLHGDVDFDAVEPIVAAITPVPGGVGAVTSTMLASHTVEAALRICGVEPVSEP